MVVNFEYAFISVVIVSLLSLVGVTTLILQEKMMDSVIHYLLSFAIGSLLATTFFELLPEAVELENGEFTAFIGFIIIFSLAGSFLLEKLIKWHHHHGSEKERPITEPKIKPYVFNITIGDSIHNFIDGIAIVIAFNISFETGVAVFLGVAVHEIAHEYGDFAILLKGGLSVPRALLLNLASAVFAIFGTIFGYFVLMSGTQYIDQFNVLVLAITAGIFLYLSMVDLIPELEEEMTPFKLSLHMISGFTGMFLVYLVTLAEVAH